MSLALLLALGCGSGHARHAAAVTAAVRDCASSGQHGLAGPPYPGALRVGPLSLSNLADPKAIQGIAPPMGGRYPALESIAVLAAAHEATVTVPMRERSTVGLLYDKSQFRDDGLYLVGALDASIRFTACKAPSFNGGVSQFDGGLVVSRPQCVELDFQVDSDPRTVRRYIAYGRPCPAP
jgi:hypothetical protein